MESRKRSFQLIAGIMAVGLAAAGCSSSGSTDTGNGGSTSGAPAPTLNGTPIVIGSMCSCTGVQAAVLGKADLGVKSWADAVNAAGGLNGHPIKLISTDDGADPSKALQNAKTLVEQDKVVAIVGLASTADAAVASYLQQKQVPVVGGDSNLGSFLSNPDFYASGSTLPVMAIGMAQLAKDAGKKKMGALYCAESPVCAQFDGLGTLATTLVGGIGYASGKVSGTAPNYTAPCLSIKGKGVDALFIADNSTVAQRVIDDCAKIGYKPLNLTSDTAAGPQYLTDPNFEGTLLSGSNASVNSPAAQEFRDALDKYFPGTTKSTQFTSSVLATWIGGKLFEAAAKAAGGLTPTSTPADVIKGLHALNGETLDGLAPPLTFPQGRPGFATCYFTEKVESGKFVDTSDKPICLSTAQVTALGQALAKMGG